MQLRQRTKCLVVCKGKIRDGKERSFAERILNIRLCAVRVQKRDTSGQNYEVKINQVAGGVCIPSVLHVIQNR